MLWRSIRESAPVLALPRAALRSLCVDANDTPSLACRRNPALPAEPPPGRADGTGYVTESQGPAASASPSANCTFAQSVANRIPRKGLRCAPSIVCPRPPPPPLPSPKSGGQSKPVLPPIALWYTRRTPSRSRPPAPPPPHRLPGLRAGFAIQSGNAAVAAPPPRPSRQLPCRSPVPPVAGSPAQVPDRSSRVRSRGRPARGTSQGSCPSPWTLPGPALSTADLRQGARTLPTPNR